jgi:Mce-associated membrane protein
MRLFLAFSYHVDRWLALGRRRVIGCVLLVGLLAVTLACGVALVVQERRVTQIDVARAAGLTAAGALTARLLSYDYRTLDENLASAQEATSGSFADEYGRLSSEVVRPNAVARHIVTSAQVVGSGVVTASRDTLVALLFVNQSTTAADQPVARIDRSRARVSLAFVGGSWRITGITPV